MRALLEGYAMHLCTYDDSLINEENLSVKILCFPALLSYVDATSSKEMRIHLDHENNK
jgi:hypothetical protein